MLFRSGKVPASGADKFDPDTAVIAINGEAINYSRFVYLMMNKPAGCISATEDRSEKPVTELLSGNYAKQGLFPAGRLDKDAEGLLLLTNDGQFAHDVISPGKNVNKRYYAELDNAIEDADIAAFSEGLTLKDGLQCLPAVLERAPESALAAFVTVREGKYHQVKRIDRKSVV